MKLIVAVDKNWGIGKKNGLLFSIPEDMKFFREKTAGKIVCMGYNTLLSFPGSKPLKKRVNIVLAPDGVKRDDCTVVHTLEELSETLKAFDTDDVFVIGGGMFYRTMLPYCTDAYITEVYADGGAEVFFEDLSKKPEWTREELSDMQTSGELNFKFTVYHNGGVKEF